MSWKGTTYIYHPKTDKTEAWQSYVCGHCGSHGSGYVVAHEVDDNNEVVQRWLQCVTCGQGCVMDGGGAQHPAPRFGPQLSGLPKETGAAYDEARDCMSVNALTAAELLCRKILMHVAVDKGAEEGKTFASYIDHLAGQGYITPPMQKWVGLIREHGNQATHALEAPQRRRAEATLMFTAELLRIVYEMEHLADHYAQPEGEVAPT